MTVDHQVLGQLLDLLEEMETVLIPVVSAATMLARQAYEAGPDRAVQAELSAEARDAARYRFLTGKHADAEMRIHRFSLARHVTSGIAKEIMDRAIDEVLAAQKGGTS